MLTAVIMAGGKGERFWPQSRAKRPKQFLGVTGSRTMLQLTVDRISRLIPKENIMVVTGSEYAQIVAEQVPDIPSANVIAEPEGRNTAACIGLAALHVEKKDPEAVMVVLPADHLIQKEDQFLDAIRAGVDLAGRGETIVTLGIKPLYPETGYGYIDAKTASSVANLHGFSAYPVQQFVEKPNLERAVAYVESGHYFWNSGMFIWRVGTIRKAIAQHMPELHAGLERIMAGMGTEDETSVLRREYSLLPKVSIDYGVMEKAAGVLTIPGDFGWDDVGHWTALERISPRDSHGNVTRGETVLVDTQNSIFYTDKKLLAAVGVEDLVVIESDDAILICNKNRVQDVREVLKQLRERKLEKYL